jgi:hypothetical protein
MIKTGLLVATPEYRDWFHTNLLDVVDTGDTKMLFAGSLDEVKAILKTEMIDIVFSGGASGFHVEIMEHIWAVNPTTSMHIKGQGMDPYLFVGGILETFSV